jgi:hypothetical protein
MPLTSEKSIAKYKNLWSDRGMLYCALPWGIAVALQHSWALLTRMQVRAILVHIPWARLASCHTAAVVQTPDSVVKQRALPLQASDLPSSEDEKGRSRLVGFQHGLMELVCASRRIPHPRPSAVG